MATDEQALPDTARDDPDSAAAVVERYWALMATNDFTAVGAILADDFVLEWPQSDEQIRGREQLRCHERRLSGGGPVGVSTCTGSWAARGRPCPTCRSLTAPVTTGQSHSFQ